MKHRVKLLVKHPLIQGSAIVVFGNLFANFFSFLFNLFMSRNLTVPDYGTLASIMSLIGLPSFFISAIGPIIIRFAGYYFSKNRLDLLRGLYIKTVKILLIIGGLVFLFFLLFITQIGQFFQITDKTLLFITNIIICLSIISIVNYLFIQAKLAFKFQVSVQILMSALKLIIGVILVFLGYSIGGAIFAVLISSLAAYLFTFIPLKFVFDKKVSFPIINTKELFAYGIPSALTLLGLTSFISIDIILVKHYFSPEQAGIYAGLALVGKVIFFVSAPIASVMFPVIVQKHSRNERFTNTFLMSVFLVLGSSIVLAIFYYLFPEFTLLFFLKKSEYLKTSNLLVFFAIYMTLYSLLIILSNFYLSIKKTNIYIPIILGAALQIILIIFYHETFFQVIIISLVISLLLNLILLLYYPYATKK